MSQYGQLAEEDRPCCRSRHSITDFGCRSDVRAAVGIRAKEKSSSRGVHKELGTKVQKSKRVWTAFCTRTRDHAKPARRAERRRSERTSAWWGKVTSSITRHSQPRTPSDSRQVLYKDGVVNVPDSDFVAGGYSPTTLRARGPIILVKKEVSSLLPSGAGQF